MRNKPRIRFKGFTEDWEQRKLSEVVTINPKTELPDEFKYVDLESVVGTNLLGFQVINKENAPSRAQRLASYGDVFYQTVRPYQRNNYLFENVDKDMVFSTGYAQLRSKLDSYFLLTLVQNDNFVKVVLDNCTGTSYPAINGSELGKITVQIPSNEVEANQIGKVFRGIDKSITLHQRKLEKLKLAKKALLQKLFPKNGSKFPELRFKGFADAWEQRKLGEVVKSYSGGTPTASNKEYYGGDIPFIRSAEINSDTTELYITQKGLDNSSAKIVEKGTILYAMYGATSGEVGISKINGAINQAILAMIPLNYDGKIIAQYLWKNKESIIGKYLQGGQGNLSANIILELPIQLPGLEESNQIAYFLESVDNIITLHQRKLDKLQEVKKGLLQKMFV